MLKGENANGCNSFVIEQQELLGGVHLSVGD